ncbi:MAG: hypothetical protein RMK74_08880 [Myxococcales bacterium]|nr:hypothetical protein [Myxococcales bacterium]
MDRSGLAPPLVVGGVALLAALAALFVAAILIGRQCEPPGTPALGLPEPPQVGEPEDDVTGAMPVAALGIVRADGPPPERVPIPDRIDQFEWQGDDASMWAVVDPATADAICFGDPSRRAELEQAMVAAASVRGVVLDDVLRAYAGYFDGCAADRVCGWVRHALRDATRSAVVRALAWSLVDRCIGLVRPEQLPQRDAPDDLDERLARLPAEIPDDPDEALAAPDVDPVALVTASSPSFDASRLTRALVRCASDGNREASMRARCLRAAAALSLPVAVNAALVLRSEPLGMGDLRDVVSALSATRGRESMATRLATEGLLPGTPPDDGLAMPPAIETWTALDWMFAWGRAWGYVDGDPLPDGHATVARAASWLVRPHLDDVVYEERLDAPEDGRSAGLLVAHTRGAREAVRFRAGDGYDAGTAVGLVNALLWSRGVEVRVAFVAADPPWVVLVAGPPDALTRLAADRLLTFAVPPDPESAPSATGATSPAAGRSGTEER